MAEVSAFYIPEGREQNFLLKLFQVAVPASKREWREHHHLQVELVLFHEGNGRYRTRKKEYTIQPDDVFVFASNEVHCITEIGEGGMRLTNIHFEPQYLWENTKMLSSKNIALSFAHGESFENRLPRAHPVTTRIRCLLMDIEQEMAQRKEEYEWMVQLRIMEIFLLLTRELGYSDGIPKNQTQQRHLQAVSAAMEFINTHLDEPLTLQQIADVVQISPNYFSALFRSINHMPLWDYVTARRVELAIQLMNTGDSDSMLDTAMRSGFNNTANFNKAFRKYTGMTPTDYRKHGGGDLY